MIIVTYSALNKFRNCRKQYENRYKHQLVSIRPNDRALEVGKIVHEGLAVVHSSSFVDFPWGPYPAGTTTYEDAEWSDFKDKCKQALTEYEFAMVRSMFKGYDRGGFRMRPEEFLLPIIHPETREPLPGVMLAGEADGLEREFPWGLPTGLIGEHKTTSRVDEAYIRKLRMDPQIHTYAYALGRKYGVPITKCVYNVIVKCNEKHVPISRLENEYKKPNMYWREVIDLDPREIERAERDIYELATQILEAREDPDRFYRNQNACFQWGRPCDYIDLCESGDSPIIAANFYKIKAPHEELTITKTLELEGPKMLNVIQDKKYRPVENAIVFVYGPNLMGKSTFFQGFPGALFIYPSVDRSLDLISANKYPVSNWKQFAEAVKDLVIDPGHHKMIVLDLVDGITNLCIAHICEQAGEPDINTGKLGYSQGYKRLKSLMMGAIQALMGAGYGLGFISYDRSDAEENEAGERVTKMVPTLLPVVRKEILAICDLEAYCTTGWWEFTNKEGKLERKKIRMLKTGPSTGCEAGGRGKWPEEIPMTYQHFKKAFIQSRGIPEPKPTETETTEEK